MTIYLLLLHFLNIFVCILSIDNFNNKFILLFKVIIELTMVNFKQRFAHYVEKYNMCTD